MTSRLLIFIIKNNLNLKDKINRTSERGNLYFTLQRRRGQDEDKYGLASLLVATWDSVTESNVNLKINKKKQI